MEENMINTLLRKVGLAEWGTKEQKLERLYANGIMKRPEITLEKILKGKDLIENAGLTMEVDPFYETKKNVAEKITEMTSKTLEPVQPKRGRPKKDK